MSGARDDRPGFAECLKYLREGDTLVVWRLDRLGRSMRHVVNTMHDLTERGVAVKCIADGIDTSTSTGRMVAGVSGVPAGVREGAGQGEGRPSRWSTPADPA